MGVRSGPGAIATGLSRSRLAGLVTTRSLPPHARCPRGDPGPLPVLTSSSALTRRQQANDHVDRNTDRQNQQCEETVGFMIYAIANHRSDEKRDRAKQDYSRDPWITPGAIGPRQIGFAHAQDDHREIGHRIIRYKEESKRRQHL